jgi:hypothetical protein
LAKEPSRVDRVRCPPSSATLVRVLQVVPSARTRSVEPHGVAYGEARRALGVLLAAVALGLALDRGWLVCPIAAFFSLPCPGCGLTRAALLLAAGDWHGALQMHPLAPLLVPLVWVAAVRAATDYIAGPRGPGKAPRSRRRGFAKPWSAAWEELLASIAVAALIAVWVLRFRGAFGGPVPLALLLDR